MILEQDLIKALQLNINFKDDTIRWENSSANIERCRYTNNRFLQTCKSYTPKSSDITIHANKVMLKKGILPQKEPFKNFAKFYLDTKKSAQIIKI